MSSTRFLERCRVRFARNERVFVVFFAGHVEEILRVAQIVIEVREGGDDSVQQLFLAAQGLSVF